MNDAVAFFLNRLLEANHLFVEGKDAGRSGAIAALVAVTDFLSFFPGTTDHQQPFGQIISALLSLDDGKVLPLLERRRRSGRHYDSAAKEIDKAMVAITVKRLCDTGLDVNEAYEKVAFVCCEAGMRPGRKGADSQKTETTARTVQGWCTIIKEDVGHHSVAARAFDRMEQLPPPSAGNGGPEAVRLALLGELRRSLFETGAPWH
jgi:hypothetical protein